MKRLHGYDLPFVAHGQRVYAADRMANVARVFADSTDAIGLAKLFSAAPELADALKDAAELAESCANDTAGTPTGLMFMVRAAKYRAALAKAGINNAAAVIR